MLDNLNKTSHLADNRTSSASSAGVIVVVRLDCPAWAGAEDGVVAEAVLTLSGVVVGRIDGTADGEAVELLFTVASVTSLVSDMMEIESCVVFKNSRPLAEAVWDNSRFLNSEKHSSLFIQKKYLPMELKTLPLSLAKQNYAHLLRPRRVE